jgi:predicted anti-sigma-YlaC factor YlaD
MEARALVEDVLDESLAGGLKRALNLHISRCDACRTFFAAEKEEHSRWFRAMNEPTARHNLPDRFTEDFIASFAVAKIVPRKRWVIAGMFRRIAAALAAMLLFVGLSYAAAVAVNELSGDDAPRDFADGNLSEMAGPSAAVQVSVDEPVADAALPAELFSNGVISLLTEFHNHQTGGTSMIKAKTAVAALSEAIAVAPLSAADGDSYRYIISTPYPEANVYHSAVSAPSSIDAGAYRVAGVDKELEARFRSCSRSVVIALNAMEFKTFIITFR